MTPFRVLARRSRKPPKLKESPIAAQIVSQQSVVEMHQRRIREGDDSPKRAAALATAIHRLAELQLNN